VRPVDKVDENKEAEAPGFSRQSAHAGGWFVIGRLYPPGNVAGTTFC